MKIQELTEQEIDINALSDEIVKAGMQIYQIVQKLIEPKG